MQVAEAAVVPGRQQARKQLMLILQELSMLRTLTHQVEPGTIKHNASEVLI